MNQVNKTRSVLVVDDNPEFREEIIPEALGHLAARVLKAQDVEQACQVVAEHDASSGAPLDLIVLDMHMPLSKGTIQVSEGAGIEVLRGLRLLTSYAPVVVFTAYGSFQNCVEAVQAGASAYLPKQAQDAYGGPEGGIDNLIESCGRLLAKTDDDETHHAPDADWLDRNYDWLSEEFSGQYVAFVQVVEADSAGITGKKRDGLVVIGEKSREELARLIAPKLPFLDEIPHIVGVPGG